MSVHECKRCGYSTKSISALKKHYNRKNPCKDELGCGKLPSKLLNNIVNPEPDSREDVPELAVPQEVGIIARGLKLYCLIRNTTTQDTKNVYINMDINIHNHGKDIIDNDKLRELFIKNIFETSGICIDNGTPPP